MRTQRRAPEELLATFRADVERYGRERVAVHHIADEAAGKALAEEVAGIAGREVEAYLAASLIGVHVGPGTVGVVYQTRGRDAGGWACGG